MIGYPERAVLFFRTPQKNGPFVLQVDRLDGNRPDGHRADGNRLDGHRVDGNRADGHRADGNRPDGNRADGGGPYCISINGIGIRVGDFCAVNGHYDSGWFPLLAQNDRELRQAIKAICSHKFVLGRSRFEMERNMFMDRYQQLTGISLHDDVTRLQRDVSASWGRR